MDHSALRSNKYNSVLLSYFDSYRRQFLVESQAIAWSHQDMDKETRLENSCGPGQRNPTDRDLVPLQEEAHELSPATLT